VPQSVTLTGLTGLPHVQPGDDLGALLIAAVNANGLRLGDGDIFVVAQKIVSKAEGRQVSLSAVSPGERAREVAAITGKDARLVELILSESLSISRMRPGLLIVRHRLGFTCANAGIDRSNVSQPDGDEVVLLLPEDPDASAERLRAALASHFDRSLGVIISDSHGRPFRLGTVGVALGVSGVVALWDRRGEADLYGYRLQHTEVGAADEIASAASAVMGQASEAVPVVAVSGLRLPSRKGRAADLNRAPEFDLYR
jgi:coenzyme F420-0:L-glutamate ligase/coenzyme F420-1:gamma-L-glutamate ligase